MLCQIWSRDRLAAHPSNTTDTISNPNQIVVSLVSQFYLRYVSISNLERRIRKLMINIQTYNGMSLVSRYGGHFCQDMSRGGGETEVRTIVWCIMWCLSARPDMPGASKKKHHIRQTSPRKAVMYVLQPERLK